MPTAQKQNRDGKVWVTVALNKKGQIVHVVHRKKKYKPTDRTGKRVKAVSHIKVGCCPGSKHKPGKHGSDPCCAWDAAANEEVCWC